MYYITELKALLGIGVPTMWETAEPYAIAATVVVLLITAYKIARS